MGNCNSFSNNEKEDSKEMPSALVLDTRCRVMTDKFLVVKDLGEGKMGKISCVHKIKATYDHRDKAPPKTLFAMKSAKVLATNDLHFVKILRKEINILKMLDHPNIIKAYEVYSSGDRNIHVCLEYCSGGNLYSHFPEFDGKRRPFDEIGAAFIMHQLLSALAHMHSVGICHRDIKFENIIMRRDDSRIIKIIDFGAATHFTSGIAMCEPIGTVYTMAREVMTGKYTEKADIWSVGVILYMMLSLTKPFYGKDKRTMAKKILIGDFKFYSPMWANISSSGRDLLRNLICKDPNKRLSASTALKHSWIQENHTIKHGVIDEDFFGSVKRSIESYCQFHVIKKVALNVMVQYVPTEDIIDLVKVFNRYNSSSSGFLTLAEFRVLLDLPLEIATEMFDKIRIQRRTVEGLCFTEFLAAAFGSKKHLTKDLLWQAFDFLDYECSGLISPQRFIEIIGKESETKNEIFRDFEAFKHHGGLDWIEFQHLFEDWSL